MILANMGKKPTSQEETKSKKPSQNQDTKQTLNKNIDQDQKTMTRKISNNYGCNCDIDQTRLKKNAAIVVKPT
jgi:hypothetical protein